MDDKERPVTFLHNYTQQCRETALMMKLKYVVIVQQSKTWWWLWCTGNLAYATEIIQTDTESLFNALCGYLWCNIFSWHLLSFNLTKPQHFHQTLQIEKNQKYALKSRILFMCFRSEALKGRQCVFQDRPYCFHRKKTPHSAFYNNMATRLKLFDFFPLMVSKVHEDVCSELSFSPKPSCSW